MIAVVVTVLACLASPVWAQWYGEADFLVTNRFSNSNAVFLRNQTSAPSRVGSTSLITEDNLELGFAPAGRITIGNRSGEFGLEGSFMRTEDWNASKAVNDGSGTLASPFSLIGATTTLGLDNNTSASVNYTTQLQTAEINLTQRIYSGANGDASLMYGARYMSIEESLTYASTNAIASHNLLTTTDNQIFGPQLGALLETPIVGGTLNFTFKCALGFDNIDKTTNFDGALSVGNEGSATVIGEVGVDCMFYPTRHFAVRIGYHLLAASQVALATNNFERDLAVLASGVANVQTDAGVAYHSPFIGAVFTY